MNSNATVDTEGKISSSSSSDPAALASSSSQPASSTTSSSGVLEVLDRLSLTVQHLDTKSHFVLSHYRRLPETLRDAHDWLQQGAALVHSTSTKYTLVGKIDATEQDKLTNDLVKGCQLLATAAVVWHEPSTGASTASRRHVQQASRAVVESVRSLVKSFATGSALQQDHEQEGAQRTGAVWQTCQTISEKRVPVGNRNAMRRDLFTYLRESAETMEEFQQLIDQGPVLREEDEEVEKPTTSETNNDKDVEEFLWDAFLSGQDEQYTAEELTLATPTLAIIKCARGSINVAMLALEAVGEQLHETESDNKREEDNDENAATRKVLLLAWMETLHTLACKVGDGVTDLGATLYPPLQLSTVGQQIDLQAQSLEALLHHILNATALDPTPSPSQTEQDSVRCANEIPLDLSEDVTDRATKIKAALANRRKECSDAMLAASSRSTS